MPLVPDQQGKCQAWVTSPTLVWASGCTSHWLSILTLSEPPLPKHMFKKGQIVGQNFWFWIDNPVPTHGTLSGYQRWPVKAIYNPIARCLHYCQLHKSQVVSNAQELPPNSGCLLLYSVPPSLSTLDPCCSQHQWSLGHSEIYPIFSSEIHHLFKLSMMLSLFGTIC